MKPKTIEKFGYVVADHRAFKKALIRIKPSARFGGIGVFAVRTLKKGSQIADAELLGEDRYYSWASFRRIDKKSQKIIHAFCAQTDDGFFAPPDINYMSIPWHMNHCCDGNVGFDGQGNFVAVKKIKKDSELCYDYGLVTCNPRYRLVCKCGSKNCRGVITGKDWQDPAYRKRNFANMSPEVQDYVKSQLNTKP